MQRARSWWAAVGGVALLASLGVSGCRGSEAHASNADIQRWLSAVQNFSNDADEGQDCYLLAKGQLVSDVSHPRGTWTVIGYNDQTGDGRGYFGCSIRADSGPKGDGEVGIELTSAAGSAPNPAQRVAVLPGTRWSLFEEAWPGRAPSAAEFERVTRDVEVNLSITPPATTPEEGVLAGPEDPITTP